MARILAQRSSTLLPCCVLVAARAFAAGSDAGPGPRPPLLQRLDGEWIMTGDVQGKPVTYTMVAHATLGGAFTELHMLDQGEPSGYEARVFIGHAETGDAVIVHWLDSFGARYSIPHGTGRLAGNAIEFTIAYADGPFRDTLVFEPRTERWELRIAAGQPDGSWAHFARYEPRRRSSTKEGS